MQFRQEVNIEKDNGDVVEFLVSISDPSNRALSFVNVEDACFFDDDKQIELIIQVLCTDFGYETEDEMLSEIEDRVHIVGPIDDLSIEMIGCEIASAVDFTSFKNEEGEPLDDDEIEEIVSDSGEGWQSEIEKYWADLESKFEFSVEKI